MSSVPVEPFDVVDLIRAKRDRGELIRGADLLAHRRLHPRLRRRRADVGHDHGDLPERHEPRRDPRPHPGDGRQRRAARLLAAWPSPPRDKHSTGGVGDKITLPLAPLVASFGVAVPQLSGRGLGHTGGTLDKLESITGWRAALTPDEFFSQLESRRRGDLRGRSNSLAPADGKLYALRDITGTVEVDPADRVLDHEQEDRRGHRGARARRQVRLWRVPAGSRRAAANSPRPWCGSGRTPASRPSRC